MVFSSHLTAFGTTLFETTKLDKDIAIVLPFTDDAHAALRHMHTMDLQGHTVTVVIPATLFDSDSFVPYIKRHTQTTVRQAKELLCFENGNAVPGHQKFHVITLISNQRSTNLCALTSAAQHLSFVDLLCTIPAQVHGSRLKALVDTASNHSMITREFLNHIQVDFTAGPGVTLGVSGTPAPSLGKITLDVQVGRKVMGVLFTVVESLPSAAAHWHDPNDALLGLDVISATSMRIEFTQPCIRITVPGSRTGSKYRRKDWQHVVHLSKPSTPALESSSTPDVSTSGKELSALLSQAAKGKVPLFAVHVRPCTYDTCLSSNKSKGYLAQQQAPAPQPQDTTSVPECIQSVLRTHKKDGGTLGPAPPNSTAEGFEMNIDLLPGARPRAARQYRLTPAEHLELDKQVKKLLDMGWVQPSISPWASSILFAPKPGGKLRLCIDYRYLNENTVKNTYPLPRIDTLLDQLKGHKYFSALDLAAGYHQIRISDDSRSKTAFRTPDGLYEWTVMPFGLTNAPSVFQQAMHTVLRGLLGKICLAYLDDIIVIGKTAEEHAKNLDLVLQRLHQHRFYCNLDKCQFALNEIKYLGHVVTATTVKPDPYKVSVLHAWPLADLQASTNNIRSFLGLAGYFRRFIPMFPTLAAPLLARIKHAGASSASRKNASGLRGARKHNKRGAPTKAISGSALGPWTAQCTRAFQDIKQSLINTTGMCHPDLNKPFHLYTDASDYAYGAVLMQEHDGVMQPVTWGGRLDNVSKSAHDDQQSSVPTVSTYPSVVQLHTPSKQHISVSKPLRPVAWTGRKMNCAEANHATFEKELGAIVFAARQWRCYLETNQPVFIHSDHNPLKYLQTQQKLNHKQARWVESLSRINWHITYIPGDKNVVADAVSRATHLPETSVNLHDGHPVTCVSAPALHASPKYAAVSLISFLARRPSNYQERASASALPCSGPMPVNPECALLGHHLSTSMTQSGSTMTTPTPVSFVLGMAPPLPTIPPPPQGGHTRPLPHPPATTQPQLGLPPDPLRPCRPIMHGTYRPLPYPVPPLYPRAPPLPPPQDRRPPLPPPDSHVPSDPRLPRRQPTLPRPPRLPMIVPSMTPQAAQLRSPAQPTRRLLPQSLASQNHPTSSPDHPYPLLSSFLPPAILNSCAPTPPPCASSQLLLPQPLAATQPLTTQDFPSFDRLQANPSASPALDLPPTIGVQVQSMTAFGQRMVPPALPPQGTSLLPVLLPPTRHIPHNASPAPSAPLPTLHVPGAELPRHSGPTPQSQLPTPHSPVGTSTQMSIVPSRSGSGRHLTRSANNETPPLLAAASTTETVPSTTAPTPAPSLTQEELPEDLFLLQEEIVNECRRAQRAEGAPTALHTQADMFLHLDLTVDEFWSRVRSGYAHDAAFASPPSSYQFDSALRVYFHKGKLVIPDHDFLRRQILLWHHVHPWHAHMGHSRTISLITDSFYWPGITTDIKKFISQCHSCQTQKSPSVSEAILSPLPVPSACWRVVSLDMITQLPRTTSGYDCIVVFVDQFSKMVRLVPSHATLDSAAFARLFFSSIYTHYGLPLGICSDRGTQWNNQFFKSLCDHLGIDLRLTFSYHPRANGQVERLNRVIEEAVRHFVGPAHDDWDEFLPHIEFSINSAKSESTGCTPFQLNRITPPLSPTSLAFNMTQEKRPAPSVMHRMYFHLAKQALAEAKQSMWTKNDKYHKLPVFLPGDLVLLSMRKIAVHHPSLRKKFGPRWIGPCMVVDLVGDTAAQIELPSTLKHLGIHDVFHYSVLKHYVESENPVVEENPESAKPTALDVNIGQSFEVEAIVDFMRSRKCTHSGVKRPHFLVKWVGYDSSHDMWLPLDALADCLDKVAHYLFHNTASKQRERIIGMFSTEARMHLAELVGRAQRTQHRITHREPTQHTSAPPAAPDLETTGGTKRKRNRTSPRLAQRADSTLQSALAYSTKCRTCGSSTNFPHTPN